MPGGCTVATRARHAPSLAPSPQQLQPGSGRASCSSTAPRLPSPARTARAASAGTATSYGPSSLGGRRRLVGADRQLVAALFAMDALPRPRLTAPGGPVLGDLPQPGHQYQQHQRQQHPQCQAVQTRQRCTSAPFSRPTAPAPQLAVFGQALRLPRLDRPSSSEQRDRDSGKAPSAQPGPWPVPLLPPLRVPPAVDAEVRLAAAPQRGSNPPGPVLPRINTLMPRAVSAPRARLPAARSVGASTLLQGGGRAGQPAPIESQAIPALHAVTQARKACVPAAAGVQPSRMGVGPRVRSAVLPRPSLGMAAAPCAAVQRAAPIRPPMYHYHAAQAGQQVQRSPPMVQGRAVVVAAPPERSCMPTEHDLSRTWGCPSPATPPSPHGCVRSGCACPAACW
jgi:hypothetical protein